MRQTGSGRIDRLQEKYQIPARAGILVVYGSESDPGAQREFIRYEDLFSNASSGRDRPGLRFVFKGENALMNALTVLREEGGPLHWTVVQDLALRRGYLDPFVQRDIRKHLLAALAAAVKDGRVTKVDTGVYALAEGPVA